MIERKCKRCRGVFLAYRSEVKRGGRVFCGQECRTKWLVAKYRKTCRNRSHIVRKPDRRKPANWHETHKKAAEKYRDRNPQKLRAWREFAAAVKAGLIARPAACADCGSETKRLQGHHDDYSKPLDVAWLCFRCHLLRHHPRTKKK